MERVDAASAPGALAGSGSAKILCGSIFGNSRKQRSPAPLIMADLDASVDYDCSTIGADSNSVKSLNGGRGLVAASGYGRS
jgi:hypothetical protein